MEEVTRQRPETPLVEVHKANDIAGRGFSSSSLPGMFHSVCAVFVIGWRSPSSMSHDAFLSVKLDHPHGSIKRARKHSGGNGSSGGAGGVSFLWLSLSLACCGIWET
jgi:hypothetical protein